MRLNRARRTVLSVALGHFSVDFSAQLPNMMYPLLAASLGMSYALIGLAALVWATASSVTQPLWGHLGDRYGRRWMAVLSPTWIAIWVAAAAFAPSYPVLLIFLALGGLGIGVFHPQGAATANEAAQQNKGASVATFFLGGHLAFAVSPLVIGGVFAAGGLGFAPLLAAPALAVTAIMALGLRGLRSIHAHRDVEAAPVGTSLAGAIGAVLVVVLMRGWAYASFNTFTPVFVSPDRPDPALAGLILSAFMAAHAAGAFAGGIVAVRFGVRRMVGYSSLVTIPVIAAFGLLPFGPAHAALAAAAGGALGLGFTPSILLVQRLIPGRVGAASGLALGVSFGAGAVGNLVTGLLGDAWGLELGFAVIAVGQISVLMALRWLPSGRRRPAPTPVAAG